MEGLDIGATVHGSLSIGVIGLVLWRDIFSCRDDVESRFLLDTGSEADMLASGHEVNRLKDVYEGIESGGPESRYANTEKQPSSVDQVLLLLGGKGRECHLSPIPPPYLTLCPTRSGVIHLHGLIDWHPRSTSARSRAEVLSSVYIASYKP